MWQIHALIDGRTMIGFRSIPADLAVSPQQLWGCEQSAAAPYRLQGGKELGLSKEGSDGGCVPSYSFISSSSSILSSAPSLCRVLPLSRRHRRLPITTSPTSYPPTPHPDPTPTPHRNRVAPAPTRPPEGFLLHLTNLHNISHLCPPVHVTPPRNIRPLATHHPPCRFALLHHVSSRFPSPLLSDGSRERVVNKVPMSHHLVRNGVPGLCLAPRVGLFPMQVLPCVSGRFPFGAGWHGSTGHTFCRGRLCAQVICTRGDVGRALRGQVEWSFDLAQV